MSNPQQQRNPQAYSQFPQPQGSPNTSFNTMSTYTPSYQQYAQPGGQMGPPMYMAGAMGMPNMPGQMVAGGPLRPGFPPQPNAGPSTTAAPKRAPRERTPLAIFDNTGKKVEIEGKSPTTSGDAAVAADGAPKTQPAESQPAAAVKPPKERSREKRGLQILDPKTNKPLSPDDLVKDAPQKEAQTQPPASASVSSTGGEVTSQTTTPSAAPTVATPTPAAAPASTTAESETAKGVQVEPATSETQQPVATAASPDAGNAKEVSALQDRSPDYPEGTWKPWDPQGKKVYPIDFLMKFQAVCKKLSVKQDVTELDASRAPSVVAVGKRDLSMRNKRQRGGSSDVSTLSFVEKSGHRASTKKVIELPRRVEKLEKSDNAWMRHGDQEMPEDEESLVDLNLKKAMGILNKVTVEKFDKLSEELLRLGTELPESSMNDFISRIFEKAVDESFFSGMYAQLCDKMANSRTKAGGNETVILPQFRKLLLNRCQIEFQKDRHDEKERLERLAQEKKDKLAQALAEAEAKGTKATEQMPEVKEAKELDEEEYRLKKNRRRMFGNIKFIGELFLRGMVTEHIIKTQCITPLIENPDIEEDALECLCKLLETAGHKLESPQAKDGKRTMDRYQEQLERIIRTEGLASRIKFMIQDVIDLRKRNWEARRDAAGPTTIQEIHRRAEREQMEQQRRDAAGRRGGGGGGGRGGGSSGGAGKGPPAATVKERVDRSRLGFQSVSRGNISLGGRKKLGRGGKAAVEERNTQNKFSALADSEPEESPGPEPEEVKRKMKATVDEYLNIQDKKEVVMSLQAYNEESRTPFVETLGNVYIEQKDESRTLLLELLNFLCDDGVINGKQLCIGLRPLIETLDDLSCDVPRAPEFLAEIVALGLDKGHINHRYLIADFFKTMGGENYFKFILHILKALKKRKDDVAAFALGQALTEELTTGETKKTLADLLPRPDQSRALELMDRMDVNFLGPLVGGAGGAPAGSAPASTESSGAGGAGSSKSDATQIRAKVEGLLSQDLAMPRLRKGISTLVELAEQDGKFVAAVTEAVCRHIGSIASEKGGEELSGEEKVKEKETAEALLPCLNLYTETKALHMVYGAQKAANSMKLPRGLLHRLFTYLYDQDVVTEDVFLQWEKDETLASEYPGKKSALEEVKQFLDQLKSK